MLLANVLTALIVVACGAGLTWLVALLFVKVVKWPDEKTVRRFDRLLKQDRGYAGPMFFCGWVLGPFVPALVGLGLVMLMSAPNAPLPDYEGRVVEVRQCDRGPGTLWWLHRCEVSVRFAAEPVNRQVDTPPVPERPVSLRLDARRALEVGDPVVWKISTDRDGETTWTYALPFERDRPKLWFGAVVGWVVAFAGSVWAGRWWTRSRPRHAIDQVSIRRLRREIRDLKREPDNPGS